jgi:hypothetical protein
MRAREEENNQQEDVPDMLKMAATVLGGILLALTLWLGNSVSGNSISLAQLSVKMDQLIGAQKSANEQARASVRRLDGHLETIWPRLREIKERIQYLESHSGAPKAQERWQY